MDSMDYNELKDIVQYWMTQLYKVTAQSGKIKSLPVRLTSHH